MVVWTITQYAFSHYSDHYSPGSVFPSFFQSHIKLILTFVFDNDAAH